MIARELVCPMMKLAEKQFGRIKRLALTTTPHFRQPIRKGAEPADNTAYYF